MRRAAAFLRHSGSDTTAHIILLHSIRIHGTLLQSPRPRRVHRTYTIQQVRGSTAANPVFTGTALHAHLKGISTAMLKGHTEPILRNGGVQATAAADICLKRNQPHQRVNFCIQTSSLLLLLYGARGSSRSDPHLDLPCTTRPVPNKERQTAARAMHLIKLLLMPDAPP